MMYVNTRLLIIKKIQLLTKGSTKMKHYLLTYIKCHNTLKNRKITEYQNMCY